VVILATASKDAERTMAPSGFLNFRPGITLPLAGGVDPHPEVDLIGCPASQRRVWQHCCTMIASLSRSTAHWAQAPASQCRVNLRATGCVSKGRSCAMGCAQSKHALSPTSIRISAALSCFALPLPVDSHCSVVLLAPGAHRNFDSQQSVLHCHCSG